MYQLKKFFIKTKQTLIKDVIIEWTMGRSQARYVLSQFVIIVVICNKLVATCNSCHSLYVVEFVIN